MNRHVLVLNDPIVYPVEYTQNPILQRVYYHIASRGISLWKNTDFYFFCELLTPGMKQTDARGFSSEFGVWEFPYVIIDEIIAQARNESKITVTLFDAGVDTYKIEQNMLEYNHQIQTYFRQHKIIMYPYEQMGRDVLAGILPLQDEMTVDECNDYFNKILSWSAIIKRLFLMNK